MSGHVYQQFPCLLSVQFETNRIDIPKLSTPQDSGVSGSLMTHFDPFHAHAPEVLNVSFVERSIQSNSAT